MVFVPIALPESVGIRAARPRRGCKRERKKKIVVVVVGKRTTSSLTRKYIGQSKGG